MTYCIIIVLVFVACIVTAFRHLGQKAKSGNMDSKLGSQKAQQINRQPAPSATQPTGATTSQQTDTTEPDTSSTDPWWHWRSYGGHFILLGGLLHKGWKKDILPIILGFVYLYIMLWLHVSKWLSTAESEYWHEVMRSGVFFLCVAGITLFALMCKPTGLFKFKFGKIGVFLAIGLGLAYFVPVKWLPKQNPPSATNTSDKSSAFGASPSDDNPTATLMPPNQEMREAELEYFKNVQPPLPEKDVTKFIWVGWHETRWNQLGADGKPLHRIPTPNDPSTSPTGILQIKEDLHREKCNKAGADIDITEGNFACGLLLYRERKKKGETGFEDWPSVPDDEVKMYADMNTPNEQLQLAKATTDKSGRLAREVAAPVNKWSDWIPFSDIHWRHCYDNITIEGSDHKIYHDGPGKYVDLGNQASIRIKSETENPVLLQLFK